MSKDRALKEEEVRLFCSILILAKVFYEGGGFIGVGFKVYSFTYFLSRCGGHHSTDQVPWKNISVENALDANSISIIEERVKHGTIKVVEEYKISSNFRSNVAKGAIFIYHLGFKEHLEKVKKSSLEVDVSYIIIWVKEPVDGEDKE
ncbi:hypothetical protein COCNU_scaffold000478G000110 [Cocos nucifera]|nr:hypothetical protein [Cocos nucifera]